MNRTEVLNLLTRMNALDGRIAVGPIAVETWHDALAEEAPDMEVLWAVKHLNHHYATTTEPIRMATLVSGWRVEKAKRSEWAVSRSGAALDTHCGKGGCTCSHTDPCYRGWMDSTDSTAACPNCRPGLAQVLSELPPPRFRNEYDGSRLRSHGA